MLHPCHPPSEPRHLLEQHRRDARLAGLELMDASGPAHIVPLLFPLPSCPDGSRRCASPLTLVGCEVLASFPFTFSRSIIQLRIDGTTRRTPPDDRTEGPIISPASSDVVRGEAATGQTPIGQCVRDGERKRETWPFTRLAKPTTNTACCTVVGRPLLGSTPLPHQTAIRRPR